MFDRKGKYALQNAFGDNWLSIFTNGINLYQWNQSVSMESIFINGINLYQWNQSASIESICINGINLD